MLPFRKKIKVFYAGNPQEIATVKAESTWKKETGSTKLGI